MGSACSCLRRCGYNKLEGTNQEQVATPSNPTVCDPTVQDAPEVSDPVAVKYSSKQKPAVGTRLPNTPKISLPVGQAPIDKAPIDEAPSDEVTIGIEGSTLTQREDCGYALQIPPGSLRKKVDVRVNVYFPDSMTHSVPEGSELVSGVYHIDSVEVELENDASLVIDHCINIRSAEDSVGVVKRNERRERNVSDESNQFQYVDHRDVYVRSDCAVVTLRKLEPASYAVVHKKERREAVAYCGLLYLLKSEDSLASPMQFTFMVVKDLNCYVKVCIILLQVAGNNS